MSRYTSTDEAALRTQEAIFALHRAHRGLDYAQVEIAHVAGIAEQYDALGALRARLADLLGELQMALRERGGLHMDFEPEPELKP